VTTVAAKPRAFAVWWSQMERWSVDSFRTIGWQWPAEVMRPLGEALTLRRHEVDPKRPKSAVPIIGKISFGGVITVTEPEARRGYKGRLFWASPGELVYSKIRVKQGSLAVVPNSIEALAVSTEYPVYRIDTTVADGRYLELVVRSEPFKQLLDGISHGGSTKTRIPPDEFERLVVPLPPLTHQRAIVAAFDRARQQAEDLLARADALDAAAEADFLKALGLTRPAQTAPPKAFAVRWSEMKRWGVQPNQMAATAIDVHAGKYPAERGTEFLLDIRHGCSASPSRKPTGLDVLKISAATRGFFRPDERKPMRDDDRLRREFDLRAGDILMCRTNGTLAYVGMSALVEEDQPDLIFPDKLIRVRCGPRVLPAYYWKVTQMAFSRSQIEEAARTAVGNYAIGTDDLWALEIPLPPLPVQQRLIDAYQQAMRQAIDLRSQAASAEHSARAEAEAMILGTRPVAAGSGR
jgi:type I restriction enzyme, S subunit